MSASERRAIRAQADQYNIVRSMERRPKLTKQERRTKVKNFMEAAGIGWMIRKLLS